MFKAWMIGAALLLTASTGLAAAARCEDLFLSADQIQNTLESLIQFRVNALNQKDNEKIKIQLQEFEILFQKFVKAVGSEEKAKKMMTEGLQALAQKSIQTERRIEDEKKAQAHQEHRELFAWQYRLKFEKFSQSNRMQLTPDGLQLLNFGEHELKVLDLRTFTTKQISYRVGHRQESPKTYFTEDGQYVVLIGEKTGSFAMYDLATWQEVLYQNSPGPSASYSHHAFSSAGSRVALAGSDGNIQILDLKTLRRFNIPFRHKVASDSLFFLTPDGSQLICGHKSGAIEIYDFAANKETLIQNSKPFDRYQFSPDGKKIFVKFYDSSVALMDLQTQKPILLPIEKIEKLRGIQFTPDSEKIILTTNVDLFVFDVKHLEHPVHISDIPWVSNYTSFVVLPDSSRLLVWNRLAEIEVVNLTTGEHNPLALSSYETRMSPGPFPRPESPSLTPLFNSHKTELIFMSQYGEIKKIDLKTMTEIPNTYKPLDSSFRLERFFSKSPVDYKILSVAHLKDIEVLDLSTMQTESIPYVINSSELVFLLTPDGSKLITIDNESNLYVRFYDIEEARNFNAAPINPQP